MLQGSISNRSFIPSPSKECKPKQMSQRSKNSSNYHLSTTIKGTTSTQQHKLQVPFLTTINGQVSTHNTKSQWSKNSSKYHLLTTIKGSTSTQQHKPQALFLTTINGQAVLTIQRPNGVKTAPSIIY